MNPVFLHLKGAKPNAVWDNSGRDLLRVPIVGEYVTTAADSPMYRVVLVIHCPFGDEYAAEVFAVEDPRPLDAILGNGPKGD